MKFSINDFFSKCKQIRSFLRIWSHLLKKSLVKNFIFCIVDSVFCLRRCYYPDLTVVQEDIGSGNRHFCFWDEFLVTENSLHSICSVYSEDFSAFYIFLCIKHATKILKLQLFMDCPVYQVLFRFVF